MQALWFSLGFLGLSLLGTQASAAPGNEILYQIITDRFADGNPANNCGENDLELAPEARLLNRLTCDPTRKDWNKYWGGDWEGIASRLSYLQDLGVTQLWISPVIENARGFASGDGTLKTAYHGFWGKDWFRLNEHWTNTGTQDWASFDRLVTLARGKNLGIIVDTVLNHTSPAYDAEFGLLAENGKNLIDTLAPDRAKWFHEQTGIRWELAEAAGTDTAKMDVLRQYVFQHEMRFGGLQARDWEKFQHTSPEDLQRKMLQIYKLADLADLRLENPVIADYMRRAHGALLGHGISGFRVDTVRHIEPAAFAAFVKNVLAAKSDAFIVGEWFGGGPSNKASMKFVKQTGMTIFDFQLRGEIKDLFLGQKDMKKLAAFLSASIDPSTGEDLARDLVTFIDNHDMPRLQAEGATEADVLVAMKLLFALRGVPCIYYGLENSLFNTTDGGRDPYNRDWMVFPSKGTTPGIQTLRALTTFRKEHPVLRFGKTKFLPTSGDALMLMREDSQEKVLIWIGPKGKKPKEEAVRGYSEKRIDGQARGQSRWEVRYFLPTGTLRK